ncbi:hypothetical protein [Sphingomonas montanisoli]|uniref:hypothetical protein n=1 Tax=Sphingomonas montanisoli TaxID=2606412 RepID=UPI0015E18B97|nr:hypothetical protein [Sphingomonas montanisoli]
MSANEALDDDRSRMKDRNMRDPLDPRPKWVFRIEIAIIGAMMAAGVIGSIAYLARLLF